jgi:hypothetical protein
MMARLNEYLNQEIVPLLKVAEAILSYKISHGLEAKLVAEQVHDIFSYSDLTTKREHGTDYSTL